jgi:hypothetical protein
MKLKFKKSDAGYIIISIRITRPLNYDIGRLKHQ